MALLTCWRIIHERLIVIDGVNDQPSDMTVNGCAGPETATIPPSPRWATTIALGLVALLCVLFGAAYIGHETPGYYWDYAGYHDQFRQLTEELRKGNWPNFLATITSSLQTSDYNVSLVLPLLPVSLLLGDSRLAYILSLVLLYLIPASIILVLLIQECWKGSGRGISFWLCVGLLSYTFFQRTQFPGIHHTLPFAFWLAPLAAWPLNLINAQATGIRRAGLGALLLGLLSAVSLPVLAWTDIQRSPLLSWSKPLQARATFPPFRIDSYPVLMDLVNELRGPEYADKQILILASSGELNPSIIAALSPELAPRVYGAGDVDLRDGFALKKALEADYIITTWKPSLHLPAQHQQVVAIPVSALFDPKNPLAKSYERKPHRSFSLSDGNTAYIFKRTSRPSQEAIRWLTAEFRKHYPSWEKKAGKIGPQQP